MHNFYYSTSNTTDYIILGDGARTQSHSAYFVCTAIALYTARPRPEGEEQACEFRKFEPFDCINQWSWSVAIT